jgi:hypothetical protein
MVLNLKSWELVKNGSFIVGDRFLFNEGVMYHPGEDYPCESERTLYALYETNQITEKVDGELFAAITEEKPKAKRTRKK